MRSPSSTSTRRRTRKRPRKRQAPASKRAPLIDEVRRLRPDVGDPAVAISDGRVLVDGVIVTNPRSRVVRGCSIVIREPAELRGSAKLRAALDVFGVDVSGRIALDVGAAAGGFTSVLLERGATRVYAVDAGHGQLLGSLRQDPRVVNLEAANVADLGPTLVPETVGLITVDVTYLSLADAVQQLDRIEIAESTDLIGLIKPMFELRLDSAPIDIDSLDRALTAAVDGVTEAGWPVVATMNSPVTGAKGARELLLHARPGR